MVSTCFFIFCRIGFVTFKNAESVQLALAASEDALCLDERWQTDVLCWEIHFIFTVFCEYLHQRNPNDDWLSMKWMVWRRVGSTVEWAWGVAQLQGAAPGSQDKTISEPHSRTLQTLHTTHITHTHTTHTCTLHTLHTPHTLPPHLQECCAQQWHFDTHLLISQP